MSPTDEVAEEDPVSEIAIVDTFTRLIFGDEDDYSATELLIIQAFRLEDTSVALDSHRDMGQYLRALGVRELVQLVSAVRERLTRGIQGIGIIAGDAGDPVLKPRTR
jgi:uncharacterized protein YunC (DUF1805 family)